MSGIEQDYRGGESDGSEEENSFDTLMGVTQQLVEEDLAEITQIAGNEYLLDFYRELSAFLQKVNEKHTILFAESYWSLTLAEESWENELNNFRLEYAAKDSYYAELQALIHDHLYLTGLNSILNVFDILDNIFSIIEALEKEVGIYFDMLCSNFISDASEELVKGNDQLRNILKRSPFNSKNLMQGSELVIQPESVEEIWVKNIGFIIKKIIIDILNKMKKKQATSKERLRTSSTIETFLTPLLAARFGEITEFHFFENAGKSETESEIILQIDMLAEEMTAQCIVAIQEDALWESQRPEAENDESQSGQDDEEAVGLLLEMKSSEYQVPQIDASGDSEVVLSDRDTARTHWKEYQEVVVDDLVALRVTLTADSALFLAIQKEDWVQVMELTRGSTAISLEANRVYSHLAFLRPLWEDKEESLKIELPAHTS